MTISGATSNGTPSGTLSIISTETNKIIIRIDGGSDVNYTVNANTITEDAGQTQDFSLQGGGTATFNEISTGTLIGKVLTINGTWSKAGYTTISFTIVATKL